MEKCRVPCVGSPCAEIRDVLGVVSVWERGYRDYLPSGFHCFDNFFGAKSLSDGGVFLRPPPADIMARAWRRPLPPIRQVQTLEPLA